ncbi:hypothetical protein OK006_11041 [Actinobacteria bacterium OK006]|nr:hypothetical protein OK006_11041 [Actinobacteria bacterium OK006]
MTVLPGNTPQSGGPVTRGSATGPRDSRDETAEAGR